MGKEEGWKWIDQIRGCGDFLLGYVSKNEDQGGRGKWVGFCVEWWEGCSESGIGEEGDVSHRRYRRDWRQSWRGHEWPWE